MQERHVKRSHSPQVANKTAQDGLKSPIKALKAQGDNRAHIDEALRGEGATNYVFSQKNDAGEKSAHQVSPP